MKRRSFQFRCLGGRRRVGGWEGGKMSSNGHLILFFFPILCFYSGSKVVNLSHLLIQPEITRAMAPPPPSSTGQSEPVTGSKHRQHVVKANLIKLRLQRQFVPPPSPRPEGSVCVCVCVCVGWFPVSHRTQPSETGMTAQVLQLVAPSLTHLVHKIPAPFE